jgi:pimeloyl-ACP methyl ester carboxylesterase
MNKQEKGTVTKTVKRKTVRTLLVRLSQLVLFGLFCWVFVIAAVGGIFIYGMTHPYCAPTTDYRMGFQPVTITTTDGLQLRAWYRPPENGAVIIILAGIGVNRDRGIPLAEIVMSHGYGALTLEDRNCQGRVVTAGYREADDTVAAVTFLLSRPGVEKIGIIGFSAGGAAAIRAAAMDVRIGAIVAEGQFSELDELLSRRGHPWYSVERQIGFAMEVFYRLWTGISPSQFQPVVDIAAISPRAVFLIFGEKEMYDSDATDQLAAAGEPKQLWVVPGAGHGQYLQAAGEEYANRIIEFFDETLLNK